MDVFPAVREAHREMRFVRTLVRRKTRVAVDAEQRTTSRTRVCNQVRTQFIQRRGKVRDELDCWLVGVGLVFCFVLQEPIAIVVSLQAGEKTEELGREVGRHRRLAYGVADHKVKGFESHCGQILSSKALPTKARGFTKECVRA